MTPVPSNVATAAETESLSARQRAAADTPDLTVTTNEGNAVADLYAALKLAGVPSPMEKWLAAVRGGDPRSNF